MAGSSVLLTAGGVVSGGLALVFHLLTARGLGPVGYGMLTASLAYAVLCYFKLDQILLLRPRGAEETGLYAVAYRVIETLLLVVSGAMTVLFPRLVVAARGEAGDFIAVFVKSWKTLWLAALVRVVNGSLWGTSLLPLLLGAAYAPSKTQLQILLFALPFFYVNYLLTQSLIARGREVFYARGAATCAGVNLGLNLFLIPAWGASGAAYATMPRKERCSPSACLAWVTCRVRLPCG